MSKKNNLYDLYYIQLFPQNKYVFDILQRIARNKNDPSHWFDYGTFCLYINDITKAEECFKECIAIDQKHLHG
jgi:hypothetical protein